MRSIVAEEKIKLILLGNGAVGKTSMATRYTKNRFIPKYKPSLGVDFLAKRIQLEHKVLKVMVFDTGGQEFISTLRKRYYHGAAGAIVVFDMCARDSFEGLNKWINELQKEIPGVHTVIVANKSDLFDQRTVTTEEGKAYAEANNSEYHETSALTGENVEKIFQIFVNRLLDSSNN